MNGVDLDVVGWKDLDFEIWALLDDKIYVIECRRVFGVNDLGVIVGCKKILVW